jgi:outer membrane receptor protein involved in Fe transport
VDGLYELSRKAVYSHPDETKNNTALLTFNLQHVLDANTELAATAYVRSGKQNRMGGDVEWNSAVDNNADGDTTDAGEEAHAAGLIRHSATSQTSYGLSANLTKILDAHQITAGASLDQSVSKYGASQETTCAISISRGISDCADAEADTAGVKGGATSFGVYLADTMKWGEKTHITVAGRFNQTTVSNTITSYTAGVGTELDEEKFTYRSLNPSFGLSHKLNDNLTVFGNWAQSNRAPTVIELGCADPTNPCDLPTGLQSDPFLRQVVARTIEGGMRWKNSSNYNLAISVYQTENANDILFLPIDHNGTLRGYFDNFAKTRYQGIDINASKAWTTVRFNAAYSYLNATYEADGKLFAGDRDMTIEPGMRLPGIPLHTIKLNMDWQATDKLSLGAGLQYSSSLRTQGNEDGLVADGEKADASIKAHTLLNVKANYQLQKGLSVFGKINNLLDTRYETYGMIGMNNFELNGGTAATNQTVAKFVAPGAPRSYMVGLRYQF